MSSSAVFCRFTRCLCELLTQPKRHYKRVEYIPDVFFMEKDEYGNDIKKIGRPLPVEYLLIDVPVTTPLQVGLHLESFAKYVADPNLLINVLIEYPYFHH